MPRVVFISTLPQVLVETVLSYTPDGFEAVAISAQASDEEKLALTSDADFLMLLGGGVSEAVLRGSPRLKHIQLLSAGYDRLDLRLIQRLGITVSTNGGANSWAVAETTVGLILALLHRLVDADRFMRAGQWRGEVRGYDSYEMAGKTAGIVGLGTIGKKVARRLAPFEVHLLYADPVPDPGLERELAMPRLPLHELLPAADVVTLHVPLLPTTRGMIGKREVALMRPSAVLVNTCRGAVVDEAALIEALRARRLRGAALDVFEEEPLPADSPLLQLPNVILGGHVAGQTYESYFRRAEFGFANLQRIASGKPPLALIDPDAELSS